MKHIIHKTTLSCLVVLCLFACNPPREVTSTGDGSDSASTTEPATTPDSTATVEDANAADTTRDDVAATSDSASIARPLEGTFWRLTELMGKPIDAPAEGKKTIHIRLVSDGKKIQAFAGCNGVGGEYEVKPGNRIKFSNMIGTMMACDELPIENSLLEVLRTADNYTITGHQLVLNKAKMAPLARFEAPAD